MERGHHSWEQPLSTNSIPLPWLTGCAQGRGSRDWLPFTSTHSHRPPSHQRLSQVTRGLHSTVRHRCISITEPELALTNEMAEQQNDRAEGKMAFSVWTDSRSSMLSAWLCRPVDFRPAPVHTQAASGSSGPRCALPDQVDDPLSGRCADCLIVYHDDLVPWDELAL